MQEIFNFLRAYWQPLVGLILVLVSLFLALVRKKPVTCIIQDIYDFSIQAIKGVESASILGSENKLHTAVEIVSNLLETRYPDINVKLYTQVIISCIEEILSTPQKKI